MNLPPVIQQSFDRMLLKMWLTDEEYAEVHKIVSFSRLGFTKFPREPRMFKQIAALHKSMPSQGGQVLRMTRYDPVKPSKGLS